MSKLVVKLLTGRGQSDKILFVNFLPLSGLEGIKNVVYLCTCYDPALGRGRPIL